MYILFRECGGLVKDWMPGFCKRDTILAGNVDRGEHPALALGVYRLALSLGLYHFVLLILLLGAASKDDRRHHLHER